MTSLTSIMRERHDFKGQLKCSAGNKPCGGRCVPNNYKCADEGGAPAGGRGRMAKRALGTAAALAGVGAAGYAAYQNRGELAALAAEAGDRLRAGNFGEQARGIANAAGASLTEAGQRAYGAARSGLGAARGYAGQFGEQARGYAGQLGEQMRGLAGSAAEAGQGALNNARSAGTELLQQGEALAGRARNAGENIVSRGTELGGDMFVSGRAAMRDLGASAGMGVTSGAIPTELEGWPKARFRGGSDFNTRLASADPFLYDSYYADAGCSCGGKCKKCKEEMEPDKDDSMGAVWADMYQADFWADAACGPGMRKCGNSCISGNSKCNSTGEKVKTAAKIGAGVAAVGGAGYAAYRNREAIGEGAKAAGSAIKSGAGAAAGAVRSGASKAWGAAKKLVGRDSVWADGYEYLPTESL